MIIESLQVDWRSLGQQRREQDLAVRQANFKNLFADFIAKFDRVTQGKES